VRLVLIFATVRPVLELLDLPFAQRGLAAVAVLAVAAGLVGTWIVLRGLAFYAHAVGTATFPGLVLADGLGFAAGLGAAGAALLVAAGVGLLARSDRARDRSDSITALVLAGALALGVILASDVFASRASVDGLLFGSLLLIDGTDIALMAGASLLALVAGAVLEHRWVLTGFDPAAAPALGVRSGWADAALLAVIALASVAALSAVGALLATALLVVPAATTRLVCTRIRSWQLATVALVLVEGVAGIWLSVRTDAPPGATLAVLAGAVFALTAAGRVLAPVVRTRRRGPALAAAALLAGVGAGCGSGGGGGGEADAAGGGAPVAVVATTTHVADFARQVGGRQVRVTQLLQPNTDPHDYEPRPSDLRAVAEADVVLASGGDLDRWIGDVAEQSGTDAAVVDTGAGRPVTLEGDDGADPHWWHDPANARHAVGRIRDAIAAAAPDRAAAAAAGAEAYQGKIDRADRAVARCMDAVPAADRKLVTDHDAFAYLARAYDLRVVGAVIPATTTQAQPSAGEVARLADTIRRERVRAVFPESSLSPRLARAIADRTGARVGGTLYADTLGPANTPGATYLGSMTANADALVRGFTGGKRGCAAGGIS
jgi:ABC-type Zn uptake system ZnuABC Zn-binding protein ZnuA/ABC-type Mn2+/Zn2+ transport system permease subunit